MDILKQLIKGLGNGPKNRSSSDMVTKIQDNLNIYGIMGLLKAGYPRSNFCEEDKSLYIQWLVSYILVIFKHI